MTQNNHFKRSMETIYEDLWNAGNIGDWVRQNEKPPRNSLALFELVSDIGLSSQSRIIDIGSGRGDYACELAKQFDCSVIAVDPIESNLQRAQKLIDNEKLTGQVTQHKGKIESLSFAESDFSLLWCRGVIVHLENLPTTFQHCHRLLAEKGYMMLQTGYATELMSSDETKQLCHQLGFYPSSLQRPIVEKALYEAGFSIVKNDEFSSEHAEFYEEQDGRCANYLSGIAKLLRTKEAVLEQFGHDVYETTLGMYHWQVYQLIGKISYHAYLLQKI